MSSVYNYNMSSVSYAQTATIVSGGILLTGTGATLLVPLAMSTFGTIVSGVGTIHAAGGVAATLQSTAAACSFSNAMLVGVGSVPVKYITSKL